jgi:EAL domain-containing protein (putative c-di-GMP-specific phosphodiesterase class I)
LARTTIAPVQPAWHAIPPRLLAAAGVLVVAAALLIPWLPPAAGLAVDDIHQDGAALLVAVALAIAAVRSTGERRFVQAGIGLCLASQGLGMTLNDLPLAPNPSVLAVTNALYVVAAATAAVTVAIAVLRGLPRAMLITAGLDAILLFLAGIVIVEALWIDTASDATARPIVRAAIVGILGWVAAMSMPLLVRPVRMTLRGPLGVVTGILFVVLASLAWLDRVTTLGTPTAAAPPDLLFGVGVVLMGVGALAWNLEPHPEPRMRRVAERLMELFPTAAILAAVFAELSRPELADSALAGAAVVCVVLIATIRQLISRTSERSARHAEQAASGRLADELRERAETVRSLARLEPGETLEKTASRICEEALRLDGIDTAVLSIIEADGSVVAAATAGLDDLPLVGRPLPAERADHIRAMAMLGPWVETFEPSSEAHLSAVYSSGIRATANAPLRWENRVLGSLGLGTRCPVDAARLHERLPTVREFGVVGSALIGPLQAARERARAAAAETDAIIEAAAFMPVFQPVLDLSTGRTVGFEALTRFADRTPPDIRFAQAEAAGRGRELEAASLGVAIAAAGDLPPDTWLSLNVSPALVSAPAVLAPIVARAERPLVLEITEHVPVGDYARLAEGVRSLDGDIRLAVDDVGAGYAGLRHILEIRPHIVKLDTALVRAVDTDIARQALITSLIWFAARTDAIVLAEGIETVRELESLREMGVALGQGFLLGRPAPAATWRPLAVAVAGDAEPPLRTLAWDAAPLAS